MDLNNLLGAESSGDDLPRLTDDIFSQSAAAGLPLEDLADQHDDEGSDLLLSRVSTADEMPQEEYSGDPFETIPNDIPSVRNSLHQRSGKSKSSAKRKASDQTAAAAAAAKRRRPSTPTQQPSIIRFTNQDVYSKVFWQEKATGEYIDAVTPREEGSDDEDSLSELSDFGHRQQEEGSISVATASVIDVPIITMAKQRKKDSEAAIFAQILQEGAYLLAHPTLPGSEAVAVASQDLQKRFGGEESRYTNEVIVACLDKFVDSPMAAVLWNSKTSTVKEATMAGWFREVG